MKMITQVRFWRSWISDEAIQSGKLRRQYFTKFIKHLPQIRALRDKRCTYLRSLWPHNDRRSTNSNCLVFQINQHHYQTLFAHFQREHVQARSRSTALSKLSSLTSQFSLIKNKRDCFLNNFGVHKGYGRNLISGVFPLQTQEKSETLVFSNCTSFFLMSICSVVIMIIADVSW